MVRPMCPNCPNFLPHARKSAARLKVAIDAIASVQLFFSFLKIVGAVGAHGASGGTAGPNMRPNFDFSSVAVGAVGAGEKAPSNVCAGADDED